MYSASFFIINVIVLSCSLPVTIAYKSFAVTNPTILHNAVIYNYFLWHCTLEWLCVFTFADGVSLQIVLPTSCFMHCIGNLAFCGPEKSYKPIIKYHINNRSKLLSFLLPHRLRFRASLFFYVRRNIKYRNTWNIASSFNASHFLEKKVQLNESEN